MPKEHLATLTMLMISQSGLAETFNIQAAPLKRFLGKIEHHMSLHGLPYHNYFHAIDVCHACYIMCTTFEASMFLQEVEVRHELS